MLLVCYDISDNRLRTRFSKFLKRYGYRIQYSVFRIKNSNRILDNIVAQVEADFARKFSQSDSVIILNLSKQCSIHRFGYAVNEERELIIM